MKTATIIDINFLQRAIEEDRRKLKLKEEALKLLQDLDALENSSGNHTYTLPHQSNDSAPSRMTVQRPYAYNLTETIRKIVESFNGSDFTVKKVEKILCKQVKEVPKNPRSRIAMVLQGFAKKDFVICVKKGFGSIPYTYKQAPEKSSRKKSYKLDYTMMNNHL